jgi:hypothetical protein
MQLFILNKYPQSGQSLVEVILASALLAIVLSVFTFALIYGRETVALSGSKGRASLLAEEGLEAVRNIRDENFNNLQDGAFGLAVNGNYWQFEANSDSTGIFTRQIIVASVDNSTSTKEITSTVTWQQNVQRPGSITLTTILNNWKGN